MKSTKTIRLQVLLLWCIFYASLFGSPAFAQTAKVSGIVTSQQSGTPVPGATVTVKNTTRSAIASDAGKFTIDASPGEILVISAVGFTSLEAKVGSGPLNIQLQEANNQLENVIVIGYGTQKKKLVTGA